MRDLVERLHRHLAEAVGQPVVLDPDLETASHLPAYLGHRYDLYEGRFLGRDWVLAIWKGVARPPLSELRAQIRALSDKLGETPIAILSGLSAYERRRLMNWQIPFIVPGHQVYLPQAMVDLRDARQSLSSAAEAPEGTVSPPAQLMLLYHLYHGSDGITSLTDWGRRLGYTTMSMSRAQSELTTHGICQTHQEGRRLKVEFPLPKRELWMTAQPYLFNPVMDSTAADRPARGDHSLILSGLSALSRYSNIGSGRIVTYAMHGRDFREALADNSIRPHPVADEEDILLEKWKYPPALLSESAGLADPLSVFLSLREDPDERVQAALQQLVEKMPW